jgi:hypothetical protein
MLCVMRCSAERACQSAAVSVLLIKKVLVLASEAPYASSTSEYVVCCIALLKEMSTICQRFVNGFQRSQSREHRLHPEDPVAMDMDDVAYSVSAASRSIHSIL